MSFAIFADSSCNLPRNLQERYQIQIIPFSYEQEGQLVPCPQYPDEFDGKTYYDYLRNGGRVSTSLLSAGQLVECLSPTLARGEDVLAFVLSSGISGTYGSALQAVALLEEAYPGRRVLVVDSLGAGLGVGKLAVAGAQYRTQGLSLQETYDTLLKDRDVLCQFFTVDDLKFLKRTGRISGVTATFGTMLQIKPILRGDEEGHIVTLSKTRGRKKAITELAELYRKRAVHPENQSVFISHGDCPEDAQTLARLVEEIAKPKELVICLHEPLTGAHVGPGMLALFFFGDGR